MRVVLLSMFDYQSNQHIEKCPIVGDTFRIFVGISKKTTYSGNMCSEQFACDFHKIEVTNRADISVESGQFFPIDSQEWEKSLRKTGHIL